MLFEFVLFALIAAQPLSASCFFRNGDIASIDGQAYQQCPGYNHCCLPTDTCIDNGLCRDKNNGENGNLVKYEGSLHNETGLYQSPACVTADFRSCSPMCTNSSSSSRAYIWACNNLRTEYCCEVGPIDQSPIGSCCTENNQFVLASPHVVPWGSPTTSATTSRTSSLPYWSTHTYSAYHTTYTSTHYSSSYGQSSGLTGGAVAGICVGIGITCLVGLMLCCTSSRKAQIASTGPPHRLQRRSQVPPPPRTCVANQDDDLEMASLAPPEERGSGDGGLKDPPPAYRP